MAELAHRKRGQTHFFSGNVNIPSGFWTGKSIYICLFCLQINTKTRTLIPPFPDCAFQKRYGLAWEPSSSIIILTALSSHFLIGGRYTGRLLGKLPFTRTFSGWSHFHTFISQYFLLAKRNHDQQEKHTIHIQNFVLHEMTLNGGIYNIYFSHAKHGLTKEITFLLLLLICDALCYANPCHAKCQICSCQVPTSCGRSAKAKLRLCHCTTSSRKLSCKNVMGIVSGTIPNGPYKGLLRDHGG